MDGVVTVYKEKGYTSHDVIAILRGVLQTKKIGHTGTLDPDAEGVLPVCLGRATKAAEDISGASKRYIATLRFGSETDTQDASGQVTRAYTYTYDAEEVAKVVASFQGSYEQIPPMYSAIKKNGIKLYDLARQGIEVERKPRPVTIHEIRLLEQNAEGAKIEVHCSKGAYIRTLCEDIGRRLNYGAHMTSLVRTASGPYTIEQAKTIDELRTLMQEGRQSEFLLSLEQIYAQYPIKQVPAEDDLYLYNGNYLTYPLEGLAVAPRDLVRMVDSHGQFVGLYQVKYIQDEAVRLVPEKMFVSQ